MIEMLTSVARPVLPLVLRWNSDEALPRRPILPPPGAATSTLGRESPPWLSTGPTDVPFDFSTHSPAFAATSFASAPSCVTST